MRKRDELTDPASCMSRARPDEMTFVLLARDEAAPDTIRDWIRRRIELGKNEPGDPQLIDAERCALAMEAELLAAGVEGESVIVAMVDGDDVPAAGELIDLFESIDPDPERPGEECCPRCGKPYEDFSDLGCGHCDQRHPGFGIRG